MDVATRTTLEFPVAVGMVELLDRVVVELATVEVVLMLVLVAVAEEVTLGVTVGVTVGERVAEVVAADVVDPKVVSAEDEATPG